jgi:hypothetical protein
MSELFSRNYISIACVISTNQERRNAQLAESELGALRVSAAKSLKSI